MRQWRLIYDYPTPGAWNMAVDEALLMVNTGPVLRLYAWDPACLSLGYGQRVADIDRERLEDMGWDLVRRPTGGRAILHTDELTYCIVLPAGHPLAAGDVVTSYRRLSRALVAGLSVLGQHPRAEENSQSRGHNGPVCFETPSQYEITLDGRKLVGSAQLRREAGIMQHGSIPLRGDIGRICDVLRYSNRDQRQSAQQLVRQQATTLPRVAWQVVADALVKGFETALDVTFTNSELTIAERKKAQHLAVDVYANPAWTERR